jgi:hypothetical protein
MKKCNNTYPLVSKYVALAPNMILVGLGWCLAQMSFHAPRLGSPLALLSSFKLFLIARAIGGSGFGMSCA